MNAAHSPSPWLLLKSIVVSTEQKHTMPHTHSSTLFNYLLCVRVHFDNLIRPSVFIFVKNESLSISLCNFSLSVHSVGNRIWCICKSRNNCPLRLVWFSLVFQVWMKTRQIHCEPITVWLILNGIFGIRFSCSLYPNLNNHREFISITSHTIVQCRNTYNDQKPYYYPFSNFIYFSCNVGPFPTLCIGTLLFPVCLKHFSYLIHCIAFAYDYRLCWHSVVHRLWVAIEMHIWCT